MLLESTFLNGIQKSTFQDALGTHVCCISAPSFTLARIIFSSFIFKKRGNVCSGKNNILDKKREWFIPAEMLYVFAFRAVYIKNSVRHLLGKRPKLVFFVCCLFYSWQNMF